MSDGDYVSLGVRESEDLEHIVEYLLHQRKAKDICLWGRSMGAVTALLFVSKSQHRELVRCCIYDSPFRSLKRLIK
ncbi:MAG: hypothetical protein JST59_01990 [Actinobacteria bacterium]|nr:hypothetical protein [Actinomycetota bacterium]